MVRMRELYKKGKVRRLRGAKKDRQYVIEVWETEEERDIGYGLILPDMYTSKKRAIAEAKNMYEDGRVASAEVMGRQTGQIYYSISKDGELREEELRRMGVKTSPEWITERLGL